MIVNGESEHYEQDITVGMLVESKGFRRDRVAIELNGVIVPVTQYDTTVLHDTDSVEIVTFVQGG